MGRPSQTAFPESFPVEFPFSRFFAESFPVSFPVEVGDAERVDPSPPNPMNELAILSTP